MIDRETESREWRRIVDDLVRDLEQEAEKQKTKQPPQPETLRKQWEQAHGKLPAHPSSARSVHRLSIDDQDQWSNAMKNRYGGEW